MPIKSVRRHCDLDDYGRLKQSVGYLEYFFLWWSPRVACRERKRSAVFLCLGGSGDRSLHMSKPYVMGIPVCLPRAESALQSHSY